MILQQIKNRRPPDRSINGCDHSAADAASKAGLPDKTSYDPGHLCFECLELEGRDDPEDSEDGEDVWEVAKARHAEGRGTKQRWIVLKVIEEHHGAISTFFIRSALWS